MSASFDELMAGDDEALFWGVVERIEDHEWRRDRIPSLPEEQQVVLRIASYYAYFGNGGLLHWFERDDEFSGPQTAQALHEIGLLDSAAAMTRAYAIFGTEAEWADWHRRIAAVERRMAVIEECEQVMWREFLGVEGAGGRYVRLHASAFADLRWKRPFDPGSNTALP